MNIKGIYPDWRQRIADNVAGALARQTALLAIADVLRPMDGKRITVRVIPKLEAALAGMGLTVKLRRSGDPDLVLDGEPLKGYGISVRMRDGYFSMSQLTELVKSCATHLEAAQMAFHGIKELGVVVDRLEAIEKERAELIDKVRYFGGEESSQASWAILIR